MKSIRDRLAVLLMLCLLVWGAVPALAAETVDETRIGSIKVLLCDTETAAPLQGGELTLYHVASVSKNGADMSFTYANGFENCGIALDNVSESALASRLAEKVTQNAQAVTKTVNDSGIAVFGDLKAGLYLIVQKQAAEGYDAIQPFLVTVPIMETGSMSTMWMPTPKRVLQAGNNADAAHAGSSFCTAADRTVELASPRAGGDWRCTGGGRCRTQKAKWSE